MKRILIVVALVGLAAIAGVLARSASSRAEIREFVTHEQDDTRKEIREKYELSPGAQVELAGLNGAVKIETSDTKTAEVYIERIGSEEALKRRQIVIEATANRLSIKSEKNHSGFFSRFFGSEAHEKVTLKLPRQISLNTKGVNGNVNVGTLDGSVEMSGINGRVEIASAAGTASFSGINGNVLVALQRLDSDGITLKGINGNIELQLPENANASLEAKGMNGRVISEVPWVSVDEPKHGYYSAKIGNGGSAITAKGINGNIRLTSAAKSAGVAAGN
ncbi:MAG TPA: DUF4097 family beta strand repeat-containing protein [Pyrinomonadaceae bacterium]|nr:DUF4097 family beta strand repeat-containing protein [Pyrinomonadaceae bacterium]